MKKSMSRFLVVSFSILMLLHFSTSASAKVDLNFMESISLEDTPLDVVISSDGETAYILCKKNILIYSAQKNGITDTISITGDFSAIAVTPDEESLLLSNTQEKQLSIIRLTQYVDIEIGQSPVIGNADAPVSIFTFLDYQKPACSKIYPLLEQLHDKYPNEVNLVIKHYPLRSHEFALKASLAALAAAKQNKYGELSRLLLKNCRQLSALAINKCAVEAGLDMQQFIKDCRDPSLMEIIAQDSILARSIKELEVPAIFVNGRPTESHSFKELSQMVEKELKIRR